jgi:hypothetical protein
MRSWLAFVMLVLCSVALGQTEASIGAVTNDATMARLRVAYIVYGGPNVDVFVNGEIAMNPGQPQTNIPCCQVTGYMYLTPGTYNVAVVPTGKGIEEALIGPLNVAVEAGHRYTIAAMGQVEDEILTPLIIDETAVVQEVRTSPEQSIMILVNNLAPTQTISLTFDGQGPQDVPYGGFGAAPLPLGPERYIEVTANNGNDIVETHQCDATCDTETPGEDFMHLRFGRIPGTWGEDHGDTEGVGVSELNALEFLQGFSGLGVQQEGHILSFDTFLRAVEIAGLTEMLTTSSPFLMFVPTDESFANVPKGQLDALIAAPETLADWLRYHIIEGYHPPGSLSGELYGTVDRTLTNMMGVNLRLFTFGDTFYINSIAQGGLQRYQVANGKFVRPITTVLLPPERLFGKYARCFVNHGKSWLLGLSR